MMVGQNSSDLATTFQRATRHHQAGQLQQAETLYRQILAVDPRHADCLQRLGRIALQVGRADAALTCFEKAIELRPQIAEYQDDRAEALKALGRLAEAEVSYRESLGLRRNSPDTLCNLATVLLLQGRHAEAEARSRDAIRLKPSAWEAHILLGHALGGLGRWQDAEPCHRTALCLNPSSPDTHNHLGLTLSQLGRAAEAEACFREALRLNPTFANAHNNLGGCLKDLNRLAEAEACFRAALRLRPNYVEAHINLADTVYLLGRPAEAEASAREAMRLRPTSAEAHNSAGCALRNLGRDTEAAACFREALRLKPAFPEAFNNLGSTLTRLGHWSEAESCFRAALRLRPTYPDVEVNLGGLNLAQGRYDGVIPQYERVLAQNPHSDIARRGLLAALPYIPELDSRTSFEIHRRLGDTVSRAARRSRLTNDRNPGRRLRIGWLSCDFRNHPVGRNLELLFGNRDSASFEMICYADVDAPDAVTDRFRGQADVWRSVSGLDDTAIADLIREDRVDIMIYLAGRFDHNRPQIAEWRPAPVQISLHDVATSGLREIDYLIADPILVPQRTTERFTERVLRLPNFYLHAPPADTPFPGDPPSMSGRAITFGCFHNPIKLNANVCALWANILRSTPNARLLFKYREVFGSEELRHRMIQRLGADLSDRITFEPALTPLEHHLTLYNQVDVALDPFPFNGSTATFEALWMGVPVVTLAGDRMVSRWGASMLTKVGLGDLIATSSQEYAGIATRLAADHGRLLELRRSLRDRVARSTFCDGPRAAHHFERLLRAVWRKWCVATSPGAVSGPAEMRAT